MIIHQHFNLPSIGGGVRSWYLAQALVDKGIEVIVITAHNERKYLKTIADGIEIHYLAVEYDNKFGFASRSSSFMKFAWQAATLFGRFKDVSLCYAISAPLTTGLSALMIKRRRGVPFIFEVGDLWPDAPVQMGFVKNYFFRQFLYQLEKIIYRKASVIVSLSPSISKAILEKVPGKEIHLIPNMADCDYFHPERKDPSLERKYGVVGKFVVSYTGAIGLANGLDYFLECANLCKRHDLPVHFIMCGEGALRERLIRHAKQLNLANLSFVDFQNREGIREILNVTDASFVCYKRVPVLETGSPNKFFDGLAAGKLMVVNFGGWIKREIEDFGCGFYADPNHPTDFINKIRTFIGHPEKLEASQKASRELAETKYSRHLLGERFANLIQSSRWD